MQLTKKQLLSQEGDLSPISELRHQEQSEGELSGLVYSIDEPAMHLARFSQTHPYRVTTALHNDIITPWGFTPGPNGSSDPSLTWIRGSPFKRDVPSR